MFSTLSERLSGALANLRGKGRLSDADIARLKDALQGVQAEEAFLPAASVADRGYPLTAITAHCSVVEVSQKPHTGCKKFAARFGRDALRFVNSPLGRELRLRGVNARIVSDGVVRPGPKVDGTRKEECRYSFGKREFIGKFDTEEAEQAKPNPKDALAAKLAALQVNHALPEIQWGDMNALIIRRVPDDFKQRPIYETYRVVKDGVYTSWFKKQCKGMEIVIPDPVLRLEMINLAKDVEPIIKRK